MSPGKDSIDVANIGEYRLTIGVGDPLSPDGLTQLSLDGSGELYAQQIYKGELEDRTGPPESDRSSKLDKREAEALLKAASQFQWDREFPPRPGIPDEAIVEWRLGKKGETSLSMKTWIQDAEKDPGLGPVLTRLREELSRLSDDELYF